MQGIHVTYESENGYLDYVRYICNRAVLDYNLILSETPYLYVVYVEKAGIIVRGKYKYIEGDAFEWMSI